MKNSPVVLFLLVEAMVLQAVLLMTVGYKFNFYFIIICRLNFIINSNDNSSNIKCCNLNHNYKIRRGRVYFKLYFKFTLKKRLYATLICMFNTNRSVLFQC